MLKRRLGILFVASLIGMLCGLTERPLLAQTLDGRLDLYILGVYEGHVNKYGKVTVFVAPQDRPIALLLTAYESVDWHIELESGARLAKVFLNGYHEQHISGLTPDIPVQSSSYDQQSPTYMYGHDHSSCFKMIDKARQFYGSPSRYALCQYRGVAFVVDRDGIRPLPVR